jgi:D-alanine-D-alanine ligase
VLGEADEAALLASGVSPAPPPSETLDFLATGNVTTFTDAPEMRGVDVIFLTLHGGAGEDGTIQTLLDVAGIP